MTIKQLWRTFQIVQHPGHTEISPSNTFPIRFDNPFIINYVVYHHYRSLGWVVRGGIKFCVDYLLYKRGPVFSHAEYVFPLFLHLTPSTESRLWKIRARRVSCI